MSSNANSQPKKSKIKMLVLSALFAAMALVLKPFSFYLLPVARFSFIAVPIIIAGITLGPVWGAAVGAVVDLAGYLMFDTSGAAMNLFITAAFAIVGAMPGLVFHYMKDKKKGFYDTINIASYFILLIGVVILLTMEGSLKFANGFVNVISPASGKWIELPHLAVIAIVIAFVLYSFVVIRMITGRKQDTSKEEQRINSMILLSTTLSIVLGFMLVEGTALAVQYGWKLSIMYSIKILQGFITIPSYSLIAIMLYPVIAKQMKKF
ncbi:MAG: folate family ECF transporter S component [Anaerofustis stercorihominis]|nr:folate family ECF transporter S component [Anaerofustis stercorihominis]